MARLYILNQTYALHRNKWRNLTFLTTDFLNESKSFLFRF